MRRRLAIAVALICVAVGPGRLGGQSASQNDPSASLSSTATQVPTITSRSSLVLVPALVRDKKGALVFTLKADDFVLTDDGVPQKLRLEEDTDSQPLALVVDIEGGGAAVRQIGKFAAISAMIESVVGDVPHKVAVVGFDSSPVLVQDFTPDIEKAAKAVDALVSDDNGDNGAAILDSLAMSLEMLRRQPVQYRRAVLLVSESNDHGSKTRLEEALRAVSDTNTVIYSVGFSSARDELKHESAKALGSDQPGPAHGCMSRDPDDPNVNLQQNPAAQAYDCMSLLAPPLRLAKAAALAVVAGLKKNIPETVARLTGGEYYNLGSEKNLAKDLHTISNHMPNRYVLSFQPQAPHVGFHAIVLTAPGYVGLKISARNGYWADARVNP